jgi:6-O-methylguanine DNA methyltransferase, DNA binding domain
MSASAVSYERIYSVVARIPRGRVATYGQVARLAGLPGRARLVGYALSALTEGSRQVRVRVQAFRACPRDVSWLLSLAARQAGGEVVALCATCRFLGRSNIATCSLTSRKSLEKR